MTRAPTDEQYRAAAITKYGREGEIEIIELPGDMMPAIRRAEKEGSTAFHRGLELTDCPYTDEHDGMMKQKWRTGFNSAGYWSATVGSTELTECGEQGVIPGCEKETTPEFPQGNLW